jgi:hypothetical protein
MRLRGYLLAGVFVIAGTTTGMVLAETSGAAPAPVVTSVTPAADTTGSQVVVSGSNLTLPSALLPSEILFGTVKAKVNSCAPLTGAASSCNVTVPAQCAGHKVVDVRVIVGTLESAVSSGDQFTYTDSAKAPPCPGASPSGMATSTSSGTATPAPTGTPAGTPSPRSTVPTGPTISPGATSVPSPVTSGNA